MKYWDQMLSKYGFNDGEAVPEGIEIYRRAYILAVNGLAAASGGHVRAIPYDRPGCHNWCLVRFVAAGGDESSPDVATDEAMIAAVEMASRLDIDDCVSISAQLREKSLYELLDQAKARGKRRDRLSNPQQKS